jgi:hypothetical protein
VGALRALLTAAMRRWHIHLPAFILHGTAAGTLLGVHLHVRSHACHRWSQIRHQQQHDNPELPYGFHPADLKHNRSSADSYSAFRTGLMKNCISRFRRNKRMDAGAQTSAKRKGRDLCRCTAEVAAGRSRVLRRVLKEFLPVFSNAFECFCQPSVLISSMSYF